MWNILALQAVRRWRRRSARTCLAALLLVAGGALAEPGDAPNGGPLPPTDHEPITPVPAPPAADPLKLALGQRLFEDRRLSHGQTTSCLSCHNTRTNGSDVRGGARAPGGGTLQFNTITVFDAALSFRFGWEGKFRTLQAQAEASLQSPWTMASSMEEVLGRLRADKHLVHQFREAFGRAPDRDDLLDAIATYEQSLLTPGSRFDRWLAGEPTLSAEEWRGYQLFKSLGCISCHQGVNVGGNLFERHGIFHPLARPKPEILRVPSLRNVATTAPYFHDGSAPTLDVAVRRMALAQLDRTLSQPQIDSIVAFLRTLTGNYDGHPVTAPP